MWLLLGFSCLSLLTIMQVTFEVKVESGDPRYVICDMAEKVKADLLVMGNHGHGAIKRW